jgi:hypothetical protein
MPRWHGDRGQEIQHLNSLPARHEVRYRRLGRGGAAKMADHLIQRAGALRRLATARGLPFLLLLLAAFGSSQVAAGEQPGAGSVAACLSKQSELDKAKTEARQLDADLSNGPSRNEAADKFVQRLKGKSVAELETILKTTNAWLDNTDPDKKITHSAILDLRDYVANLDAWKTSGGVLDEPRPPASMKVDLQEMNQRRTLVAKRIAQLKKDLEAMGCNAAEPRQQTAHCDAVTAQEAMADEIAALNRKYPAGINSEKVYDWEQATVQPMLDKATKAFNAHDYDGACAIWRNLKLTIEQHKT